MSERTKVTHCVKGHPAGWCDCRVFKPAPPGAFAEPSDPRPAAVSAPAGEATNGLPISDDELLRRASTWLVTDAGESPYTRDLIAMLSERLSQCQPAPASGAPDEDELMAALRSDRLPLSQGQCERIADLIDALRTRLAASERAGEAMREALTFYANRRNWSSPSTGFALQYDPEPAPVARDCGAKARAALSPTSPAPSPEVQ